MATSIFVVYAFFGALAFSMSLENNKFSTAVLVGLLWPGIAAVFVLGWITIVCALAPSNFSAFKAILHSIVCRVFQ